MSCSWASWWQHSCAVYQCSRCPREQHTSGYTLPQHHQLQTKYSSLLGTISGISLLCTLRGLVDSGGDEKGRPEGTGMKEMQPQGEPSALSFWLQGGGRSIVGICSHAQILQSCCLMLWNSKHFRSDKGG